MEGRGSARVLGVERNQILNVGLLARERATASAGILIVYTRDATIAGNTVEGVARFASTSSRRYGIAAATCGHVRITGNVVSDVGPPEEFAGTVAGIALLSTFQHGDILDNTSRRALVVPQRPLSEWIGILVAGAVVSHDALGYAHAVADERNIFTLEFEAARIVRFA